MKSGAVESRPVNRVSEVQQLSIGDFARRIEPGTILMCEPTFFTVQDVKNPFMEGKVGTIDKSQARAQWEALKKTFEKLGYPVKVVEPQPDLEDMVFTANQVLPGLGEDGRPFVLLGEMKHPSRQREVPWFRKWFMANGYRVITLGDGIGDGATSPRFEGQGDALWHPGRRLLWGGHGFRTEEAAYDVVLNLLKVPIVKLKLINEAFYHLDTCFAPLDQDTVMVYPPAFDADGLNLIRHFFKNVIEVGDHDANNFACNAVALGKKVILQKDSPALVDRLRQDGFDPIEVETGEFMKSGGSVFCLKMMIH